LSFLDVHTQILVAAITRELTESSIVVAVILNLRGIELKLVEEAGC
jgi:hypothetical protein